MRLSISNIAWDVSEDEDVLQLLKRFPIDAIDVAPGKYFLDPGNASLSDIQQVRNWWADQGIEITGMQSLLFGTVGLNIFGSENSQSLLLEHLAAICKIGSGLGATRLVFGSPKNRDRTGLSDEEALSCAVPFFRKLGDVAGEHGVIVCLEPIPKYYGTNFMTTSFETAHVVCAVDHPCIRMQLDSGALTINGESVVSVLKDYSHLIGHVHASEPNLVPLGDHHMDHGEFSKGVRHYLPDHTVAVEMLATKEEPHLSAIERALSYAIKYYRSNAGDSA